MVFLTSYLTGKYIKLLCCFNKHDFPGPYSAYILMAFFLVLMTQFAVLIMCLFCRLHQSSVIALAGLRLTWLETRCGLHVNIAYNFCVQIVESSSFFSGSRVEELTITQF